MTELPPNYPLTWPSSWPRSEFRTRARYRVSFSQARDELFKRAKRQFPKGFALTTNIPLRLDGRPLSSPHYVSDPAVALWWIHPEEGYRVLASDRYDSVLGNMRAVGLALEALVALERSGAEQVLERAVRSFNVPELPRPRKVLPAWVRWLELETLPVSPREVKTAFKKLTLKHHPDTGGDPEAFLLIQAAYEEGLEFFKSGGC